MKHEWVGEDEFMCIPCKFKFYTRPGYSQNGTYISLWTYCPNCGIKWESQRLGYEGNELGYGKRRWINHIIMQGYRCKPRQCWSVQQRYPNIDNLWSHNRTVYGNFKEVKRILDRLRQEYIEEATEMCADTDDKFRVEYRGVLT